MLLHVSHRIIATCRGPLHSHTPNPTNTNSLVTAAPGFRILATMNPGGDYGKRELSPALRSRFTEVWVPPLRAREDVEAVVLGALVPRPLRSLGMESLAWLAGE